MDNLEELIVCKLKLAETQEQMASFTEKSRQIQTENTFLESEIERVVSLCRSLKDSISSLKEHRCDKPMLPDGFKSPTYTINIINFPTANLDLWTSWKTQKREKLHSLARKGIPTPIRGEVWHFLVGNSLKLNRRLFERLVEKLQSFDRDLKDKNGMLLIPMDLKRTLVKLKVFQENKPLHPAINNILEAFAAYRPDIGYIQGMG